MTGSCTIVIIGGAPMLDLDRSCLRMLSRYSKKIMHPSAPNRIKHILNRMKGAKL